MVVRVLDDNDRKLAPQLSICICESWKEERVRRSKLGKITSNVIHISIHYSVLTYE